MMTLLWLRRLYNDDARHFFCACDSCEMYSMSRTGVGRHEDGVINSKEGCGGSNQVTEEQQYSFFVCEPAFSCFS